MPKPYHSMKRSTLYTGIAGFLYLTGFAAIIGSIGVFFITLTLGTWGVAALAAWLFGAGCVIIWGGNPAADEAFTWANTWEHPQWVARQLADRR